MDWQIQDLENEVRFVHHPGAVEYKTVVNGIELSYDSFGKLIGITVSDEAQITSIKKKRTLQGGS